MRSTARRASIIRAPRCRFFAAPDRSFIRSYSDLRLRSSAPLADVDVELRERPLLNEV